MLGYFFLGHYLFLVAHSFPRATLSENCSLLRTECLRTNILAYFCAKWRLCQLCIYPGLKRSVRILQESGTMSSAVYKPSPSLMFIQGAPRKWFPGLLFKPRKWLFGLSLLKNTYFIKGCYDVSRKRERERERTLVLQEPGAV